MSQPAPSPAFRQAETYFGDLQARITAAFEHLEGGTVFERKAWNKPAGEAMQGGGTMALMRGRVFEKVGVNISTVNGTFSEKFRQEIPGAAENGGRFRATGISLVAHMANPHCPAVHMNLRRIETARGWFGGGADLTPTLEYADDTAHFHAALKAACDGYKPEAYQRFKAWCEAYFQLPHRGEARGVGGIFFDDLDSGDAATDFTFVRAVGEAFLPAFVPLVEARKDTPFTLEDRQKQLLKRGRYVEFNLLYDRGTRFGLMTSGNAEAILMSLPPEAAW
jgi:coproporphyrinogen III oxidase